MILSCRKYLPQLNFISIRRPKQTTPTRCISAKRVDRIGKILTAHLLDSHEYLF